MSNEVLNRGYYPLFRVWSHLEETESTSTNFVFLRGDLTELKGMPLRGWHLHFWGLFSPRTHVPSPNKMGDTKIVRYCLLLTRGNRINTKISWDHFNLVNSMFSLVSLAVTVVSHHLFLKVCHQIMFVASWLRCFPLFERPQVFVNNSTNCLDNCHQISLSLTLVREKLFVINIPHRMGANRAHIWKTISFVKFSEFVGFPHILMLKYSLVWN